MDISGLIFSDSDSDDEFFDVLDAACFIPAPPKRRLVRERVDFYKKYDDIEFESRFRLTKEMARQVATLLRPVLEPQSSRNMPIPVDIQILITLRYYATACFETMTADLEGIHQTTAGRIVKKVSHAIAALARKIINMPTEGEWKEMNQKFFQMGGIPRVIGVIDGKYIMQQFRKKDRVNAPIVEVR